MAKIIFKNLIDLFYKNIFTKKDFIPKRENIKYVSNQNKDEISIN